MQMAEEEYSPTARGKGATGSVYTTQPKPYLRNPTAKDAWSKLERDNRIMANKLRDIGREPPATFLAPNGYDSLKRGSAPGSKAQSSMPNTITHVDVVAWPPKRCQTAPITRVRSQAKNKQESKYLAAKLVELYTSQRPRNQVNPGGVYQHEDGTGNETRPDCLGQWALRSQIYYHDDGTQQHLTAPVSAVELTEDNGLPVAEVCPWPIPRLLELAECNHSACKGQKGHQLHVPGFVRCAGCHVVYSFDQADRPQVHESDNEGRPVTPGEDMKLCSCKQVYYCSQLCARMDWISHKAVHNWHTMGHVATFGKKPAEEHWVVNEAMRKVRQKLRKRGEVQLVLHACDTLVPQAQLCSMAGVTSHQQQKQPPSHNQKFDDPDRMYAYYKKMREKEKALEAVQKRVEDNAYWGLDGPRPCMFMGGKPL